MLLEHTQDYVLPKSGLFFAAQWDPEVERLSVDSECFDQLPFFHALNRFMREFFVRNLEKGGDQFSYVIWGGLAANLVLNLIGRCGTHYSLHDVELFLTKEGRIYQPEGLMETLQMDLSSSEKFLLDVGGQSIIKKLSDMSVLDFQRNRVRRKDGDLHLNNVILIVDDAHGRILVDAPSGTLRGLIQGGSVLEMKDASDLRHIDHLARRIYRNISKAVRFQQVAGLNLAPDAMRQLKKLITSYFDRLHDYFHSSSMATEERASTKEWLDNVKIASLEGGMRWLFIRTLSETAKRLAGVQGLSNLDQAGFCRFLLGERTKVQTLFDHPWINMVSDTVTRGTWRADAKEKLDIARQCYWDFTRYQRPGAEKLCEIYSLDYGDRPKKNVQLFKDDIKFNSI